MIIQINTDKTIEGDDKMKDYFTGLIKKSLRNHESHITRIEVHLKDENGHKEGVDDINCTLEARLKGRKPVAVSCNGDKLEHALIGAVDKMDAMLITIIGRLKKH